MEDDIKKAYAEVDKILSFMENKYVEMIPLKLRELFKSEKLSSYEPSIDPAIPLEEQDLQRKTAVILAILNLSYWCESKEEKEELLKLYEKNSLENDKVDDKTSEKDDMSITNEDILEDFQKIVFSKNTELIKYDEKQGAIRKILDKIVKFFKRKK